MQTRANSSSRPTADRGATSLAGRDTAKPGARAATRTTVRATGAKGARVPDAIALLRADHKAVTEMFGKFDKMRDNGAKKKALAGEICQELTIHTTIEEEIFYPAAREALKRKGEDLLDEAQVEHDGAKALIAQIEGMQPGDDLYDAKVTVLSEYIKHHVKEEQEEMFPKVKKTSLDLKALGAQMQARKEELKAG